MAYVSIYRKYRPSGFQGIVGQDHIVRVLSNQIKMDTIGHAYLLTGTRGTGKTSVAKIFAKAVNCTDTYHGSPCGNCETCKALADPSNLDVIEIDAASNNGVDEIRELRESVKYPPVYSRFKVYIIDEVHMLSMGAFNALLKTLEEPPKHVIFILATTEVHKLPQTIMSRCLRFDFRLVPTAQIASRIKYIFDDMSVKYTDDAVLQIAEAGDGSVRDALSVADMCVSYGEGSVSYDTVLEVLGASNPNSIIDIIECVLAGDIGTAFEIVESVSNYGKSMSLLARDITRMFRNLYIAINAKSPYATLNIPRELAVRLIKLFTYSSDRILQSIEIMSGVEASMRYSSMPRVLVETALAKCSDARSNVDLNGVIVRLKALEDMIANGGIVAKPVGSEQVIDLEKPRVKREFSKSACCGFLIKTTRNMKKYALYAELSDLGADKFSCVDGVIYIKPTTEIASRNLNNIDYHTLLKQLVIDEFAGVEDLVITVPVVAISVADDIAEVKKLFAQDSKFLQIIEN